VIQLVNTFFSTISGSSAKIGLIGKIRSSLAVNDAPRRFSFGQPKRKKSLGANSDVGLKVDAALVGILRIQTFQKKVATYELACRQGGREYHSMFLCGSMSRCFAAYPE
jgi:hypothetical protein